MKKLVLISIFYLAFSGSAISQNYIKPSDGKAIVYFVQVYIEKTKDPDYDKLTTKGNISWMETRSMILLFENDTYLGKYDGYENIYYECDPGKHLFWSNKLLHYIEAELLANKVYIIYIPILRSTFDLSAKLTHSLNYEFNYYLLPIDKTLSSCRCKGFTDYFTSKTTSRKHHKISEVTYLSKSEKRKIDKIKKKSKALYKHKTLTQDLIPVLLTDMYIRIN